MKKLFIACALVACAAYTHAASFDWKTAARGGTIQGPGTDSALAVGTAYLFTASSAQSVFDSWKKGKTLDSLTSLDSNSISAGKIGSKAPFDYSDSSTLEAIFAVTVTIKGVDYLYISSKASGTSQDVGSATIQFKETATSSEAFKLASNGYQGAGWYAIPEPTSGLMILLGLAGLALRRKQA